MEKERAAQEKRAFEEKARKAAEEKKKKEEGARKAAEETQKKIRKEVLRCGTRTHAAAQAAWPACLTRMSSILIAAGRREAARG